MVSGAEEGEATAVSLVSVRRGSDACAGRAISFAFRHKLAQESEALTVKIGVLDRHAGDVAARPRKAGNQSSADRVPIPNHHDRDDR
jgi:hypothetical protein